MGVERVMVSSKLDRENAEFLDEIAANFKPYEVSQSSLVNTLLRVIRRLHYEGKLDLEPRALQALMGTESRQSRQTLKR